ncbi:hypothetical protein [Streptomyces zaomyceticus]|uniref:hypothetical protein n=1 Tax=Streptomyces zaomyceticus TaxID=68286 RepID=UPI002E0E8F79|nr:hypothetical protein OG237_06405 [Streptomyces zaomyceticus]
MTADQLPLWHDGWETEADAKAGSHRRTRRWPRTVPTDYGRPGGRREIPRRPVVNVIGSL